MKSKLRTKQPKLHANDVQGRRKVQKMANRKINRKNYALPEGTNCYNRWAWLFTS